MSWKCVDPNPPDHNDWLKCEHCGWLALRSKMPNPYASVEGDPCKYCATPIVAATEEHMKNAYPNGQFMWVEDDCVSN